MITTRLSIPEDAAFLHACYQEPGVLRGFPMSTEAEVEDSIRFWMYHAQNGAGLSALVDGKVAGMIVLNIQSFGKFSPTCLFSLIVDKAFRKQGVGTLLVEKAEILAKEQFHIEILHLEVYEGNTPAIRLYERLGYSYYGTQKKFIKDDGAYLDKVLMEKKL